MSPGASGGDFGRDKAIQRFFGGVTGCRFEERRAVNEARCHAQRQSKLDFGRGFVALVRVMIMLRLRSFLQGEQVSAAETFGLAICCLLLLPVLLSTVGGPVHSPRPLCPEGIAVWESAFAWLRDRLVLGGCWFYLLGSATPTAAAPPHHHPALHPLHAATPSPPHRHAARLGCALV